MARKNLRNLLCATALVGLQACGGGGGGISIDFPDPPSPGGSLSLNTDVFGNAAAFVSAVRQLSEDSVLEASEAIEAFKFVQKYNGTFDPGVLNGYTITIDGQTMSLEKGWYALVGYTKKYYEGKETFWNNLVEQKQYDDESVEFLAIKEDLDKDQAKDGNIVDNLADTGKATIDTTKTTTELSKTEKGDIKYGDATVTYGDWQESNTSNSVRTDTRKKTTTTPRTQVVTKTYIDTTTTTFSNGDTKITKALRTVSTTETLSADVSTTDETRQVKITATYTDISVTDEVVITTYGSVYQGDTVYGNWSDWTTQSTTATNKTTDVDNGDGTITRTTRKITSSSQQRTRDVTDQKYRLRTIKYTSYTERTWTDGKVEKINQTFRTDSVAVTYGDAVVTTDTENRTIDDAPGVVVSSTNIQKDPSYTDNDPNLGTKTAGYSSNKIDYETYEYQDRDSNGNLQSYSNLRHKKINSSSAYSRGWTGKGVTVAVADTGYDTDHSEFSGQVTATKDYTGTGINDTNGHGTHVLGTMVAKKDDKGMHGVAFDSKAIVIKAGTSSYINLDNAAKGLSWAASQGASVGNLSANSNYDKSFRNKITKLSDGTFKSTDTRYDYSNNVFYNMQDPKTWKSATDQDMIIVNAAGNQGLDVSANPGYFATATDSNGDLILGGKMLIAGALDNNGKIASYSNKAGHICQDIAADNTCNDKYQVKDFYILAPGSSWSARNNGSYSVKTGTSMAAPYISGGAALLRQMWPYMKGENIVKLMTSTACTTQCISGYNENIHGAGLLDLDEATKPQGAVGIPTTGRTTSSVSSVSLSNSGGSGSSISALANSSALSNVMIVDEFARDFYVDMTQSVTAKDTRKFSDVQVATHGASYLPYNQQYGSYTQGGQFPMFTDGLELGLYTNGDGNGDWSTNISNRFKLSDKFSVKTTAGIMNEQQTWLGNYTDGALGVGKNNETQYGQLGFELNLGSDMFTFDVAKGYTDVNTGANSLITSVDRLESQSMKLGYEKKLQGDAKWGITYSIPNRITNGNTNLRVPHATTLNGEVMYKDTSADMSAKTPEKDIGFYYAKSGANELEWTTSFNIEYRNNVAGVAGDNDVVSGLQISKKFYGACKKLFGMANNKPFCKKVRAEQELAKLNKNKKKNKTAITKLLKEIKLIDKQLKTQEMAWRS